MTVLSCRAHARSDALRSVSVVRGTKSPHLGVRTAHWGPRLEWVVSLLPSRSSGWGRVPGCEPKGMQAAKTHGVGCPSLLGVSWSGERRWRRVFAGALMSHALPPCARSYTCIGMQCLAASLRPAVRTSVCFQLSHVVCSPCGGYAFARSVELASVDAHSYCVLCLRGARPSTCSAAWLV